MIPPKTTWSKDKADPIADIKAFKAMIENKPKFVGDVRRWTWKKEDIEITKKPEEN